MAKRWKRVKGFSNYRISSEGNLEKIAKYGGWRESRTTALKKQFNHYLAARLSSGKRFRRVTIHQLVAEAFLRHPCIDVEINHKNGIKWDNRVENLEWVTRSENTHHAINILGRRSASGFQGTRHRGKLNKETARMILDLYNDGARQVDLADRFGITQGMVSSIITGRYWSK